MLVGMRGVGSVEVDGVLRGENNGKFAFEVVDGLLLVAGDIGCAHPESVVDLSDYDAMDPFFRATYNDTRVRRCSSHLFLRFVMCEVRKVPV